MTKSPKTVKRSRRTRSISRVTDEENDDKCKIDINDYQNETEAYRRKTIRRATHELSDNEEDIPSPVRGLVQGAHTNKEIVPERMLIISILVVVQVFLMILMGYQIYSQHCRLNQYDVIFKVVEENKDVMFVLQSLQKVVPVLQTQVKEIKGNLDGIYEQVFQLEHTVQVLNENTNDVIVTLAQNSSQIQIDHENNRRDIKASKESMAYLLEDKRRSENEFSLLERELKKLNVKERLLSKKQKNLDDKTNRCISLRTELFRRLENTDEKVSTMTEAIDSFSSKVEYIKDISLKVEDIERKLRTLNEKMTDTEESGRMSRVTKIALQTKITETKSTIREADAKAHGPKTLLETLQKEQYYLAKDTSDRKPKTSTIETTISEPETDMRNK